jgi:hypothetical protein
LSDVRACGWGGTVTRTRKVGQRGRQRGRAECSAGGD